MPELLLVEDDRATAAAIASGMDQEGFSIRVAPDGGQALASIEERVPDVMVLDLMLPVVGGAEVLKEVRRTAPQLPILILSARDAMNDRVVALESGADDYLVKPFGFAELLARVKALLRRSQREAGLLVCGDLVLDPIGRTVTREETSLDLTPREFDLLACLMRRPGEAVARETLKREVWKLEQRATPIDNVLEVHIARLRRKVDAIPWRPMIHTVRGVGFCVGQDPPWR
ncbi:MAG TPA: response regulator transcription factor [Burkholderiaceae bacterium]|nr:response regulator transcription factor [Burkholderiaceae bacterium]